MSADLIKSQDISSKKKIGNMTENSVANPSVIEPENTSIAISQSNLTFASSNPYVNRSKYVLEKAAREIDYETFKSKDFM